MYTTTKELFKGDSLSFSFPTDLLDDEASSSWKVRITISSDSMFSNILLDTTDNVVSITDVDLPTVNINTNISAEEIQAWPYTDLYIKYRLEKGTTLKTIASVILKIQPFMLNFYVKEFRNYIKDFPELNTGEFWGTAENTDESLSSYLVMSVTNFNNSLFDTYYTIESFPSKHLLFMGALIQLLVSNGIISARCQLSYQDSGGISVQNMDRWGRYQQLFNNFYQIWKQDLTDFKKSLNCNACFGGINSEYFLIGRYR